MSSDFGRVGNDGMDGRWTVWRSRKIGMKRTTLIARMKKHGILRPAEESNLDQAVNEDSPAFERR